MSVTVREERPSALGPLSPAADFDLALMLLIRHFERNVLELFSRGKLQGTTHTCLGQEYIPVALRPLLRDDDFVFSNHRGHGHYLARYQDPRGLLAEIMGREGAICGGVGGSQHIFRPGYLSTGVQGESLPVAAGMALRLKDTRPGAIAAAYIGDGTWGEGAVYEALNIAQLWRLPLLVIVEHNGIAQSTPTALQMAGTIAGRAHAFGIMHHRTDSIDLNMLRAEAGPLIERTREECLPAILEFATCRLGPHSKGDETRAPEQVDLIRKDDWYGRYATAFPLQFQAIDARQRALIAEISSEVEARPPADWGDAWRR
jgi:pyruvate dehydrogenase E1 component alpha subunit